MSHNYLSTFVELIVTPFQQLSPVWGIVPLYFGLLLSELTSAKANFRTAIQTGFSFLWAGAQWLYLYHRALTRMGSVAGLTAPPPITLVVTFLVLAMGAVALFSGIRRRYPTYCSFLGYTRFSNYFMITIYPIQAHALSWTWERLAAIVLFAVPIWLLLHFGLKPLRR
jgi:hypothetical protein